ncbi:hypothetical protein QEZ54_29375 [Catellatospora sp. KI3]|uniref:hypothetical protein n=1 Tax=Catellatospora sp. KI3 TaxID=3041620 RepID=UPI00248327E6|nr:hypothetical protein [Catellatospora sp. KI3]MDI1465088.1 hypothetical protein [Catellatospora sp. KI3]
MERQRGWRRVLLGLLILVVVGGVGAGVAAVVTYHQATKIDRSVPEVVVAEYLRAALQNKDAVGIELYACEDASALSPINSLVQELTQREHDFNVQIVISWGALTRVDQSGEVRIQTDLSVTALKDGSEESSSRQRWIFGLKDEDGWRVCSAERGVEPSAQPSPSASLVP